MHLKVKSIEIFIKKNFFSLCCVVVGIEKIDPNQGCLFIARHSTHNGEILGTVVAMYHMTGRVLR